MTQENDLTKADQAAAKAAEREAAKVAQAKAEKQAKADAEKAAKKAEQEELKAKKEALKSEAAAKAAEVAAAKAAKEAEKQAKVAEREAAKVAREEEKARKIAEREANRQPEQNGVRRPGPNGSCGKVWAHADALSTQLGRPVAIAELMAETDKESLNQSNVRTEYARWKKFHGISGKVQATAAV